MGARRTFQWFAARGQRRGGLAPFNGADALDDTLEDGREDAKEREREDGDGDGGVRARRRKKEDDRETTPTGRLNGGRESRNRRQRLGRSGLRAHLSAGSDDHSLPVLQLTLRKEEDDVDGEHAVSGRGEQEAAAQNARFGASKTVSRGNREARGAGARKKNSRFLCKKTKKTEKRRRHRCVLYAGGRCRWRAGTARTLLTNAAVMSASGFRACSSPAPSRTPRDPAAGALAPAKERADGFET